MSNQFTKNAQSLSSRAGNSPSLKIGVSEVAYVLFDVNASMISTDRQVKCAVMLCDLDNNGKFINWSNATMYLDSKQLAWIGAVFENTGKTQFVAEIERVTEDCEPYEDRNGVQRTTRSYLSFGLPQKDLDVPQSPLSNNSQQPGGIRKNKIS